MDVEGEAYDSIQKKVNYSISSAIYWMNSDGSDDAKLFFSSCEFFNHSKYIPLFSASDSNCKHITDDGSIWGIALDWISLLFN